MNIQKFLLILFTVLSINAYGKDIQVNAHSSLPEIDKQLGRLAERAFSIDKWDNDNDVEELFIKNLEKTLKLPRTFNYKFPSLTSRSFSRKIWIVYSDDSLFRVFTWLSPTSGTMLHQRAVFQAQNIQGKVLCRNFESKKYYGLTNFNHIFHIRSSMKQFYLTIGYGQYSSGHAFAFRVIQTYEVTENTITDKTDILLNNKTQSSIILLPRFGKDIKGSIVDLPESCWDSNQQVLTIPDVAQVTDEGLPNWSGRFLKFKFTGVRFERLK
jgi:hypothetical protein